MSLTTLFFVSVIVLFVIGVPMGVSIGLAGIFYIIQAGIPEMIVIQKLFGGIDQAALMAIPFFILAGNLMVTGGLATRIVQFANSLVGNLTGGLALVTVLGCMFFAAISGSSVATAAAMGSIMIPAMVKKGYSPEFAGAVVATSSPLGGIIPPSVLFIVYGSMTSTSVKDLYLMGLPAGIIMGVVLGILFYFISKKRGYSGDDTPFSWKEVWRSFLDAAWALGIPIIMIGGVFSGWFTPTESGVIAVIYALVVGVFIYKDMTFKDLIPIFSDSAKLTGTLMFIIANAGIFSFVLTYEQIPQMIVTNLMNITENPVLILLLITVILLAAGTFMETIAIMLIMVPMFFPVVSAIGVDPVVFGILITINLSLGMVTPPFGVALFTTSSVGNVPLDKLSFSIIVPLLTLIGLLLLYTFAPGILLFFV